MWGTADDNSAGSLDDSLDSHSAAEKGGEAHSAAGGYFADSRRCSL